MKVLLCKRPGEFVYEQRADPILQKDHALIKIARIGICGTDLHAFQGNQPYFEYPRVLGHELSGTLVACDNAPGFEAGETVTFIPYFNCGTCIACRSGKPNCCTAIRVCGVHIDGGMAEYLSVPSSALVHGAGMSPEELALVEPQAIGAHAIRRAAVREGEFVLVVGAGPIGLGAMAFAGIAGATVIALDTNSFRLSLCRGKLDIPHVIDARSPDITEQLRRITGGDMPAVVIDATGNLSAIHTAFRYMAHGGRYILLGLQKGDICFSHPEFHKREGTLMSSRNATREDFEQVILAMKQGRVRPLSYVTDRVKFNRVKDEFPRWLDPGQQTVKALVEMD
ncbi:zinc-binding alcohol dehydrogenase family protein [Compostibacter hankyongensis]|uniref:Zinc-binding alcohol dehydrogenase family protein n=1 Tax=Compostibacter hankyongensis TaxID=1007089 RepID=A0ABP8FJD2_9BACT